MGVVVVGIDVLVAFFLLDHVEGFGRGPGVFERIKGTASDQQNQADR